MSRFALALLVACACGIAVADIYPNKPIRFIVPYPPGGSTDVSARLVAEKLADRLGQPIVVDNRPGAGGNIGTELAKNAPADGYTMVIGTTGTFGINPALYKHIPYDALKDFAPVALATTMPLVMVVHPSVPSKSVQEFIAYAKTQPGKLLYGSAGNGSSPHLTGAMFGVMTGIDIVHVPYKGSAPAMAELLGGNLHFMFDPPFTTYSQIKAGKLRALGVTTATRSPALPDVPTVIEAGVPGFEATAWNGVLVPAKTPAAIVERLQTEIAKLLHAPEIKEKLEAIGVSPAGGTSKEFGTFIRSELAKWAKIVKDSGATID